MVTSLRGLFSSQTKIQENNSQGFQGAKIRGPRVEANSAKEDAVKLQLSSAAPTSVRGDTMPSPYPELSTSSPTDYSDYRKKQKSSGGPLQGADKKKDDRRPGDIDGDSFVNESDFNILNENKDIKPLTPPVTPFVAEEADPKTFKTAEPAGGGIDPKTIRSASVEAGEIDSKSIIAAASLKSVQEG